MKVQTKHGEHLIIVHRKKYMKSALNIIEDFESLRTQTWLDARIYLGGRVTLWNRAKVNLACVLFPSPRLRSLIGATPYAAITTLAIRLSPAPLHEEIFARTYYTASRKIEISIRAYEELKIPSKSINRVLKVLSLKKEGKNLLSDNAIKAFSFEKSRASNAGFSGKTKQSQSFSLLQLNSPRGALKFE